MLPTVEEEKTPAAATTGVFFLVKRLNILLFFCPHYMHGSGDLSREKLLSITTYGYFFHVGDGDTLFAKKD